MGINEAIERLAHNSQLFDKSLTLMSRLAIAACEA
jgi:hypothetical protein